jgi:transcription initiation factor TFIID subunit 6
VEGVQPLIPENPPAIPREPAEPDATKAGAALGVGGARSNLSSGLGVTTTAGTQAQTQSKTQQLQQQQLVKQVLSRELQLYYTRLTASLQPATPADADQEKRAAALASLRHDAGLQALLPYLVRWVGEGVVGVLRGDEAMQVDGDGATLEVYIDVIGALLDNSTLFVEPYVSSVTAILERKADIGYNYSSFTNYSRLSSPPSYMPHFRLLMHFTSVFLHPKCSHICSLSTRQPTPPCRRES